ncbi:MAG: TAXI family TRAP transporter solute-binding subunit [Desulfobacterales bacterium]|nr:TAXI family TRAP transporter solute-binding subunit [Desulfobacterales bacterium]
MKKGCLWTVLSLFLVFCVLSSGFAQQAPERPKNLKLTILGMQVGTSIQYRAELFAEALRKAYPDWSVRAVATVKGPADVLTHRSKKSVEFFVGLMPWGQEKAAFGPLYKKRGIDFEKDFAWTGVIPSSTKYIHCIVKADTGITSLKDMIDKKAKIKVGLSRPSHEGMFRMLTGFYGASFEDIEGWGGKILSVNFGTPVGPESLREGKIDMGFAWTGLPNPPFLQAAADLKLRLLPIAPEPGLLKKSEFMEYYRAVIPANAYPFNPEDVITTAATEWLSHVPGTVSEDVVYYVTKGIMSQKNFLAGSYPEFASVMTPEYIAKAVAQLKNPVDPGALRFYREAGYVK